MLYPTAPPRMLTDLGFTDTLESSRHQPRLRGVPQLTNPYAAVPRVHTCFSLIWLSCFFLVRWRPLGIAWLFYPALIIFSIVATGNHFWLDAILGAGIAACPCIARAIESGAPDAAGSARRRLHPAPVAG